MYKRKALAVAVAAALGSGGAAHAVVMEVEGNNTFATRNVLPAGETTLDAALAQFVFMESLVGNDVDQFLLGGLTPGDFFEAEVDNTTGTGAPDTVLGRFDENGNKLAHDDDGGILGDGYASGLSGTVNADGSLDLRVSGFNDFDFNGLDDVTPGPDTNPHGEVGDYTLYVQTDDGADVDYFSFTGLTPGQIFVAQTDGQFTGAEGGELDTVMGLFDDGGTLRRVDDDSGSSLSSAIAGIVPSSGRVNLAVSGFSDFDFDGPGHDEIGPYTASIETFNLGDPAAPPLGPLVELPSNNPGDGFFVFDFVTIADRWVNHDPVVNDVIGYTFEILSGPGLFKEAVLPALPGDSEFELLLFDGSMWSVVDPMVMAGEIIDFLALSPSGLGVDRFRILGIDPATMLDPTDPLAFLTQISFTESGQYQTRQTPIHPTPEPTSLALLGLGFGVVALRRRRRT